MNPSDEARAAVIMKSMGLISIETAVMAMSGIMIDAIAVLDTTSFRYVMRRLIARMMRMGGRTSRTVRCLAMMSASPLMMKASERQIPPPKRIRIPQGMVFAVSQSSVYTPD